MRTKKINRFILALSLLLLAVFSPIYEPEAAFDGEILRFHVIANSDSPDDQALKLKVRDRVLEVFGTLEFSDAADAEKAAIRHASLLREAALDVIDEEGYNYNVTVSCGVYPFPVKSYGSVTLPEGNYKAVRVVIGEGKGRNWWCVMYPPLCFVDEAATFDEDVIAALPPEIRNNTADKPQIRVKFKLAEILEKII